MLKLLKEPSTWAGVGVIAGALIPALPIYSTILQAIAGAAGGLAVILREGATPPAQ